MAKSIYYLGSTRIAAVVLVLVLGIVTSIAGDDLDWDELKFTQEWGFSACRQFKDASREGRTCRYEGKPSIWSIHGIWPTKIGTSGPNFCSKVTFDITQLTPIMTDLKEFWYEIDDSKDEHHFWEHEWVKHGSCAKELDTFSTELKYFSEALQLRNKLDLYSVLKSGGGIIPHPTKGYSLADINAAFKVALGTQAAVPYVQCLRTKGETNEIEFHLLAVEICLDKNLNIVDCSKKTPPPEDDEQLRQGRDQALPCPKDAPILYQDYLPPSKSNKNKMSGMSWMKQTFLKGLPMSKKYWKKLKELKRHQLETNLVY